MTDYQKALELRFESSDLGETTVKDYLIQLLITLLSEEENFSVKRPFGNSGWLDDLVSPLIENGFIPGTIERYPDGDVDIEYQHADAIAFLTNLVRFAFDSRLNA